MPLPLFSFILIGAVAMYGSMLLIRKKFGFTLLKILVLTVLLTVAGVISVLLMFFIENGKFGGVSFFGAVFFVPLLLFPISKITKTKYSDYLDISAPCIAVMLAIMKINCLLSGCCAGRVLGTALNGSVIRFPSQLCEMAAAVIIAIVTVLIIKSDILKKRIYPLFMILYGCVRFALNLFRETEEMIWGLAIGNIWAVVSVIIGTLWLIAVTLIIKNNALNN